MWPDPRSTRDLLEAAGGGGREAVDRLLERYRDALKRLVRLRLDPAVAARVDASDVVQDVLLAASQRVGEYLRDPSMPFHLWLRCIAADRVADAHRVHRRAGKRAVDRELPLRSAAFADRSSVALAAELQERGPTPAAEAMRHELALRFHRALAGMEDDDREIVVMRHYEGLSNREAAQALGLTDAAAGMRHLRALRRLRAALGSEDSGGPGSARA